MPRPEMKIFAAGIATETNTFCPIYTSLEDFAVQRDPAERGSGSASFDLDAIWGVRARASGDEFVLGPMALAQPAGITTKSAYESLRDEMLSDLRAAMPVDIVLLMLHGAMVAQGYDDCEEDMVRRVREVVGPEAVIAVELDLHCHLRESLLADADIVITYKEYPHVDVNERAAELFELAVQTRLGNVRPTMALFDCRMIGMYPTSRQPLRGFIDDVLAAERRPGVLSISFGHGFQFADVPHAGAKILVITDNDQRLAGRLAKEFGLRVHALRQSIGFDSVSLPMQEALSEALATGAAPVVVADQSDNVGGGAPGDATFALRWLLEHRAEQVGVAIVYDPEVVRIARKAGEGAALPVRLGGKLGRFSGDPVDLDVSVLAIKENHAHFLAQQFGEGISFPLGDVAALRCRGEIDIVVSSVRCQCYSPAIFSDMGIDAGRKRLLIVKSMQHFYGAFSRIAAKTIYMAAPGAVAPDPRLLSYRRLDTRRMYPWTADPFSS
jgi:microcystin degradation protein MlrC